MRAVRRYQKVSPLWLLGVLAGVAFQFSAPPAVAQETQCVLINLFESSPRALAPETLRSIRDLVLSKDAEGGELIRLYYQHSTALLGRLAAVPGLRDRAVALLSELEDVAEQRLSKGETSWTQSQREAVLALLHDLNPFDGSELDFFLSRLSARVADEELTARVGVSLERDGETFAPQVSYIDSLPATPGEPAAVRIVGDVSGSDLQVGRLHLIWPPGFTYLGLPTSQQVGTVTLEIGASKASTAILSDGSGRAVADTNGNGAFDASDAPIVVVDNTITVTFEDGGDGLPELKSSPGSPHGRLIIEYVFGLFGNPPNPAPLGLSVLYSLRAVSAETGLAADGTLEVSGAVPVTIANLTGRLIGSPAVVGSGEQPALSARLTNTGSGRPADLYLGIHRPDGALFTLDGSLGWVQEIAPILSNFEVPPNFDVSNVPLPQANVFSQPGEYRLYFAAFEPGTFDFISLTTTLVRAD